MENKGCVVVFGTFDGLHKGHMAVLNTALSFNELTPIAVTFSEPPKRMTTNSQVPMLLTAEDKNRRLKAMGFEDIFVLDYNKVHNMSPDEFLDMIFAKYNVKVCVCGFNYRFGKNGEGDAARLSEYCRQHGAESAVQPATDISGHTVSSSLIRELIAKGDISFANTLLGRPFEFTNEVVHGAERGRQMGFPTVNVEPDDELVVPKFGVYASAVTVDGIDYPAVTNIGIRPTFLLKKPLSETHIFDFNQDVYGKKVTVKLLSFIREEVRFDGLEQLKSAIEKDKETALSVFKTVCQF